MNYQNASNKSYIDAIDGKKDSSRRGGRLKEHKNSEKKIFSDIKKKLDLKRNDNSYLNEPKLGKMLLN